MRRNDDRLKPYFYGLQGEYADVSEVIAEMIEPSPMMNLPVSREVRCDACDLPASVETAAAILCAACAATVIQFVIEEPFAREPSCTVH